MSVHTRQDLEKLSRFARQRFSHALMSDTKWRKLFAAVSESGWRPSLVIVKFIDSELDPQPMRWPGPNSFWGPPAWMDTIEFGPTELRSIEWVMIPSCVMAPPGAKNLAAPGVPQDMAAIIATLERTALFPLEQGPEGLKIIGYR